MPKEKTSRASGKKDARSTKDPERRAGTKPAAEETSPESRIIEVLKAYTVSEGLSLGDVVRRCGTAWRRTLAVKLRLKRAEATSTDAQGLVYSLWEKGLVFVEPPPKGKRAVRFWSLENARKKFPLVGSAGKTSPAKTSTLTRESLREAYDKFVPDHMGGFVPIYKVRRELAGGREEFDELLKNLNEMDEPIIDLLGGNPQQYTEDQKQDSFRKSGKLFLRMRWRGHES